MTSALPGTDSALHERRQAVDQRRLGSYRAAVFPKRYADFDRLAVCGARRCFEINGRNNRCHHVCRTIHV